MLLTKIVFMMTIAMPQLPYSPNALEPVISEQTINYHYGKHLQAYVNTLGTLVQGTEFEGKSVDEIVMTAPDGLSLTMQDNIEPRFVFWSIQITCKDNVPTGKLADEINATFGSFDEFKKQFAQAGATLFGSGWVWLAQDKDGKLIITKEANAGNPLRHGQNPLMGIDVWEHAYYLDYQNRRVDHLAAVWDIINWDVVASRLK